MSSTFRAFVMTDSGTPRWQWAERTLDSLDAGDVVVRVAYASVNYKDALAATGHGRILRRATCIGGIDFSGTVETSADARFAPGDRVVAAGFGLGVSHDGGYAEYVRVPGDWLTPLPGAMSLWDAMALGAAGFTSALALLRMEQNDLAPENGAVVVSGATGGVGSVAIMLLAQAGYRVTALTGKPQEADYLRSLGAADVLSRREIDPAQIKPLGKAMWAGGVDNLGGDTLAWMLSTTQNNGVIAAIGLAQNTALATTVMPFILRGVSLLGINSADGPSPARRAAAWQRLAAGIDRARLPAIARTVAFTELPATFQAFIDASIRGRTVVAIGAGVQK